MNTIEKNIERQVQLWSLPGPAAILLTVSIVLLTAPFHWATFPLIAFIGMIAAFFRGVNGAGIFILLLAVATILQLAANDYQNGFWIIGGSCALALAWIATALSCEEIDSILQKQKMGVSEVSHVSPAPVIETKIVEKVVEKVVVDQEGLQKANVQISELEILNTKIQEELTHAIEEIQALQKQGELFPMAMKKLQVEQAQIIAAVRKDLDDALKDNVELEKKLISEQQARQEEMDHKHAEMQEMQRKDSGLEMLRIELDKARKDKEKVLYDSKQEFEEQMSILRKEMEELKSNEILLLSKNQGYETSLNKNEKQIESLKAEVLSLNFRKVEEHSIIKREKDKEIEALKREREAEFDEYRRNKEIEIETLKKEKEIEIKTLKKEKEVEIETLKKDKEVEIETLKKEKEVEIETLKKEKEVEIETLKKEKDDLKTKEDAVVWGDSTTKEGRELSKVQGMYQQLRGQYNEKSTTLDQTRFELFHTKERLEALQKDWDEEKMYDRSATILSFERHIKKLENEIHTLESENQALEELVNSIV